MDPVLMGGLIKAGGNLLSGLLGSGGPSISEQYNMHEQHVQNLELKRYKATVQGALAAGLNPLTVIRGGAVSGSPATTNVTSPLGLREYAAEAFSGLGEAIASTDPVEKESRRLDNELKRRALAVQDSENVRQGPHIRYGGKGPLTTGQPLRKPNRDRQMPGEQLLPGSTNPAGLPVIDAGSIMPEDYRIMTGPYAGRYVVPFQGKYLLSPPGWTPSEPREGMSGSVVAEFDNMTEALSFGWKEMAVNHEGATAPRPVTPPNYDWRKRHRRKQLFRENLPDMP